MTLDQLACWTPLEAQAPDIARAARDIANIRVRSAATLGGNLAASNSGYDLLPLLIAGGRDSQWSFDGGPVGWAPAGVISGIPVPARNRQRLRVERRYKPIASIFTGLWQTAEGLEGVVAVECACDQIWTARIPAGTANPAQLVTDAGDLAQRMTIDLPTPPDSTVAGGAAGGDQAGTRKRTCHPAPPEAGYRAGRLVRERPVKAVPERGRLSQRERREFQP